MRMLARTAVGLLLAYTTAATVAPGWVRRAGLDAWNWSRDDERFRAATAMQRDLDDQIGALSRRSDIGDAIAARYCTGAATRAESVDAALALGGASPEWFAQLRRSYESTGLVAPGADDRDVAATYLRFKIRVVVSFGSPHGDPARAAVLADMLARFDAESDGPVPALAAE
jgi:hypothetical protein